MASSGTGGATRRSTRQQSRDPDQTQPAPPSPAKARGRPRTARSASAAAEPKTHQAPPGRSMEMIPEESNVTHQSAQFTGSGNVIDPSLTGFAQASMNAMRPNAPDAVVSEDLPLHIDELYSRSKALLHQVVFKRDDVDYLDELSLGLGAIGLASSQRLYLVRDNFENSRQAFTQDTYINTTGVLLSSINQTDPSLIDQGNWRPDAVLEKANLASLALRLAQASTRTAGGDLLSLLDSAFPLPFLSGYYTGKGVKTGKKAMKNIPAGFSHLSGPTFEFLLAVRTQLAIARLQAFHEGELPGNREDALAGTFFAEGKLRSCEVDWTSREGTFTSDQQKFLKDRAVQLQAAFHPDGAIAFDELETAFPWQDFKLETFQWIRWRDAELEGQIVEQGGVLEISDEWSRQMTMPADQPKRASKKPAKGASGTKSFLSALSGTQRPRATAPTEGDAYEAAASPQQERQILGKRARGVVVGRIPAQSEGGTSLASQAESMAKRARMNENERELDQDASQDGGFQMDERSTDAADKLRRSLNMHDNSAEIADIDPSYMPASSDAASVPMPPQDAGRSLELTPAEQYLNAQAARKQKTDSARVYKAPQKRMPFSDDEINAVQWGIEACGAQYSAIKKWDKEKNGNVLANRSAEDIRHKARNMKYDYLVAGVPLPPRFDEVLLDKKFQVKLTDKGILYQQDQARRAPLVRERAAAAE